MNFLADENLDWQIVERLRRDGHRVLAVAEMEPGISDDLVLELANRGQAILLTGDKDFGELVYRRGQAFNGVILIRLAGLPSNEKAEMVALSIHQHTSELSNAFTVITSKTVRIRRSGE
jgi:predicted nuclease of predicted toxin-antitoxin system